MQKKSQLVSFLLTFFFGALGLLYSSVTASIIMIIVSLLALASLATGSMTFLFLVWIADIIIGVFMVNDNNEEVDVDVQKQKEIQEEAVKKAIDESKQKDFIQEQMIEKVVQNRLKELNLEG